MIVAKMKNVQKCPWYLILFMVFVVFCTDVKISIIKISEIGLLLYFVLFLRKFDKPIRKFLNFFIVFAGITFFHNLFLIFDYSVVDSFLKQPYICTIGRFLEVLSCLVFMQYVTNILRKYGVGNVLSRFYVCSCFLSLCILVLYFLFVVGIQVPYLNIADEGTLRLTGFYVEGGPFGLMCSSLALLGIHIRRPKIEILLFCILTFLAQSKAGLVCLLGYFCVKIVTRYYRYKIFRVGLWLIVPIIIFVFIKLFSNIAEQYISSILDTNYLDSWVNANPEDYSSTAGRIPATYIIPKMFIDNPFFGIGIGNYPILRNLPEYRSFFPKIDIYDASGYGGFVDILNQCGLVGLVLFLSLIFKLYKMGKDYTYVLLFCLPLLFGVQYTFAYPWLMLSFVLISK